MGTFYVIVHDLTNLYRTQNSVITFNKRRNIPRIRVIPGHNINTVSHRLMAAEYRGDVGLHFEDG